MLRFRLRQLMDLRGISQQYNFLIRNGFSPNVATRCINDDISQLKLSHITKLCVALKCTPNDLFEWRPNGNMNINENHPLNDLIRDEKPFHLFSNLNNLSLDQMKEVKQFIESMKSSKSSKKDSAD